MKIVLITYDINTSLI